jgi:RNA polymerase sigma factor (sigma-70 family)
VAWARGLLRGMSTAEQLWPAMPETKPGQATAQKPALTLTLVGGAASLPLSLDAELVARALRGGVAGAQAEEALYRRYHGAVSRLASSFSELDADEADDVVQEAFVKAFRSLPKFRAGEPFAPWLLSIVANETKNLLRSRHRRNALALRLSALEPDSATPDTPFDEAAASEGRARLLAAVNALPDRERQALVCRYFLDLSEAETAQVLQWPLGSVKSRTSRGLGRLRGLVVPEDQGRVFHG